MNWKLKEPKREDFDTDEEYDHVMGLYEDALEARAEMRRERLRDGDR